MIQGYSFNYWKCNLCASDGIKTLPIFANKPVFYKLQ